MREITTSAGTIVVCAPTLDILLHHGDRLAQVVLHLDETAADRSWPDIIGSELLPAIDACCTLPDGLVSLRHLPLPDVAPVLEAWMDEVLHPNVLGLVRKLLARLGIPTGLLDRLAGTGPVDDPGRPSPTSSPMAGRTTTSATSRSRRWWRFWQRSTRATSASASS